MSKAPASLSPYNETLSAVTGVKLKSLARQKELLSKHYAEIRKNAAAAASQLQRLEILYKGIKECPVSKGTAWIDIEPVSAMVQQAAQDRSMGDVVLGMWCTRLEKSIEQLLKKFEYAYLFDSVLTEWLQTDGNTETSVKGDSKSKDGNESFIHTGRAEGIQQREMIEDMIFSEAKPDLPRFHAFLNKSFAIDGNVDGEGAPKYSQVSKKEKALLKRELERIRQGVKGFGKKLLLYKQVNSSDVENAIMGLLVGDCLGEDKRATCMEIKSSSTILQEIASVINILLRDLKNWKWPEEGVNIRLLRQLNGRYRAYLDEELLTAIFLQFVGIEWSAHFRNTLNRLMKRQDGGWKRPKSALNPKQRELHKHMIEDLDDVEGLTDWRDEMFWENYFMNLLPTSAAAGVRGYNEDLENIAADDIPPELRNRARAHELKQQMLHRIITEVRFARKVHPDKPFTVVHADLKMFGPSLSHEVLLHVMEFLGMERVWLGFFEAFLKVNSKFSPEEPPAIRTRGVPISHALSTCMAEVLMFFLEFSVNRETAGMQFFRMHDDFWFWDSERANCEKAWRIMKDFAAMLDMEFNEEKSGSVRILTEELREKLGDKSDRGDLPGSEISWGFLTLHDDGVFRIADTKVEEHIVEMKRQLAAPKSILGFINAYNRYAKFVIRHFGEPARVFGEQHMNQIIKSLNHIHLQLFPETNGDVLLQVSSMVKSHFPSAPDEILEAWILWPMSHGGLGLTNHMIDIITLLRATSDENKQNKRMAETATIPAAIDFDACEIIDKENWKNAKKAWEKRLSFPDLEHLLSPSDYEMFSIEAASFEDSESVDEDEDDIITPAAKMKKRPKFLSYEDYLQAREHLAHWKNAAEHLCEKVTPVPPKKVEFSWVGLEPFKTDWHEMNGYWMWVLTFYGKQLEECLGSLDFMPRDLIPLGMIENFKMSKAKLDQ